MPIPPAEVLVDPAPLEAAGRIPQRLERLVRDLSVELVQLVDGA
jgi:hypothetical protein